MVQQWYRKEDPSAKGSSIIWVEENRMVGRIRQEKSGREQTKRKEAEGAKQSNKEQKLEHTKTSWHKRWKGFGLNREGV